MSSSVLPTCANCNAALQGPYCSNCGQKASDYHRPIWWILGEFMDAVFSYDSRTFRTLWLLFGEPGEFTRRYNTGQRASLLPPFRLFLIATFLFFLTLQITGLALIAFETKVVPRDSLPPEAMKELQRESAGTLTTSDEKTFTTVSLQFFVPIVPGAVRPGLTAEQKESLAKNEAEIDKEVTTTDPDEMGFYKTLKGYGHRIIQGFQVAMADPLKLNTPLNVWLPRVMLLLVPVFALLLALMHWWPRVYYIEHLIFALHIHTVMFVGLTIVALAVAFFGTVGFLEIALGPILFVYFLMAMKRVYNRGWFLTSVKTIGLVFVYSLILTATLSLVLMQALSEL
jgi:hypothetical protein